MRISDDTAARVRAANEAQAEADRADRFTWDLGDVVVTPAKPVTPDAACCAHPVDLHAYNGCARCGCAVRWDEHPDRLEDQSPEGIEANDRRRLRDNK